MPDVPVRPRVLVDGDDLSTPAPLEDVVGELLERGVTGYVRLVGPPGCGKSFALRHLEGVVDPATVRVVDGDVHGWPARAETLVLFAADGRPTHPPIEQLSLVPWTRDDLVEYLLARYPERCASVLERVAADPGRPALEGNAELWALVLDEMAARDDVATAEDALRARLDRLAPEARAEMRRESLWAALNETPVVVAHLRATPAPAARLLDRRFVRDVLGAEQLAEDLRADELPDYLIRALPDELLLRATAALAGDAAVRERLERALGRAAAWHRTAAELLHALDLAWLGAYLTRRSESGEPPDLRYARLPVAVARGARAPGIELAGAQLGGGDWTGADLDRASLRGADLSGARLVEARLAGIDAPDACLDDADLRRASLFGASLFGASMRRARLGGATLRRADLSGVDARDVDLGEADLRQARLDGARLARANLEGARLWRAELGGVDLRSVRFQAADFSEAVLTGVDLEGVRCEAPSFAGADLRRASLTSSSFPRADLQRANLAEAGLAEVDWPLANLLGADLTHASFHLGSSRSGRVGGYPGQGTRTGFYTDESLDQGYRAPEEIRKANLRGADLRGARVLQCDFYLVDLREALYTAEQAAHFRRTGAILDPG